MIHWLLWAAAYLSVVAALAGLVIVREWWEQRCATLGWRIRHRNHMLVPVLGKCRTAPDIDANDQQG
jgi:hypothetical protein